MSDNTIPEIRAAVAGKQGSARKSFADHPLVQLTLVRFREFLREPEALFWVFVFPILLAAGLGIAFRNRPADVLKIAAVTPQLAQSLRQEKLLDVQQLLRAAAEEALRTGKVALLAEPGPAARWCTATTTPIPKGAPRACWRIAPCSAPRAAPIRWPPATG